MHISMKDRNRLRDLTKWQVELANNEKMRKLYQEWENHGSFSDNARPMIRIETQSFEDDIIPPLMECEGEEARNLEKMLLNNIVNHTLFEDDTLVPAYLSVPMQACFIPFGLEIKKEVVDKTSGNGVGHRYISYLHDLHKDFSLLKSSIFISNEEETNHQIELLNELLGDIIPIKRVCNSLRAPMTYDIIHIMSMEDMYIAMYDTPDLFHKLMEVLTNDYCRWFEFLEHEKLLRSTTKDEHLCQGSYCFTNDLLDKGEETMVKDIWGFMDSQESSGISPSMYQEFIFPYYKRIAERFGHLSYGCCEAVHPIWDSCLSTLGNLRKVSVSAWCDEVFMGERLREKKIVYLRKPTANLLGVGSILDEDTVRDHFRKTAIAARGCTLEIAQRNIYQIGGTSEKVKRYIALIREVIDKYYTR